MAAKFIISAARPEQFPPDGEAEVAFLGRSNVGKSSLINRLLSTDGLAYVSARPGCTQSVNFFETDEQLRFVDLPGYGYARVPKVVTGEWKQLIERYLLGRESLRLAVIVLDARRGWMESDLELKDWLEAHARPYQVVATKIDKLKTQKEKQESRQKLQGKFAGQVLECSAATGRGMREIWQAISNIKIRQ